VKGIPEGVVDAIESLDTVKVDTLVQEFFAQQSLKILPQAPFGDAVNQFVSKDDKHAVEMFVVDSLTTQVKGLLQLDDDKITEGLDAHIEDFRKVMEKSFVSGQQKQALRKRRFKEKPDGWDSDLDGHWNAQPDAIEEVAISPEPANSGRGRAGPTSGVAFSDDDGEPFDEEPDVQKAPPKRAAATRTAKKAAPAKKAAAPAKKAAAPKKAPARGRKKANPFQDNEEEEEEDVIMEDDDDAEPAPPARAPPARPTRETRARGSAKTRQTTLSFSQPPKAKASQKAIEISDDEISEDDAFESMPATRSRRR
jgi:double-strand break repair protein MRE11